ncbi:hypothetical protein CsSME_00037437 [Camellia sinensis var. sinensis]
MAPSLKISQRKKPTSGNNALASATSAHHIATPLTFFEETQLPNDTQTVVEETQAPGIGKTRSTRIRKPTLGKGVQKKICEPKMGEIACLCQLPIECNDQRECHPSSK